ncbi:transcriptional corepressor LEUNIG-like isoform X2 [Lycium barbarum]|uniref:transcriptional corepressor LEUNIG-like isoform X2 n=1 Tax=Lycium barbarum TaxID=112863 RepID=UPI00293EDC1B|nr:transcriptional corepressor LEUNIG-like isoform X2 [Lycium barbarum]
MDSWDAQKMLDKYIHDYLIKKGMIKTAETFAGEANVTNPMDVVIKSPEGFLAEWWNVFFDIHSESAHESYAEAAQAMDNVAHNISPVVPAFRPEKSQDKCHLLTADDEVTSNLKSLETDLPSQRVPFVTNSSLPMDHIPNMFQQSEAKERTMQMEPNPNTPGSATLPRPEEPSEAETHIRFSADLPIRLFLWLLLYDAANSLIKSRYHGFRIFLLA